MGLDAVVVGAGPNGLAAAITLATQGRSVRVLEARDTPGGGARTAELTIPGYLHDVCSAIHPLAAASPFMRSIDLAGHGAQLVQPEVALAHPLDDGGAALHRSIDRTASELGPDGRPWRRIIGGVARRWDLLAPHILGPLVRVPRHPLALAGFGLRAASPASVVASAFANEEARALFGGSAAHSFLPLGRPLTGSFGLVLSATAHVAGWPAVRGGTERLIEAMVAQLEASGGELECGRMVRSLDDVPESSAVLFDTSPGQLASIAGDQLPRRYAARLRRFRPGPGIFKLDYSLSEPVPWTYEPCRRAGTVHVGGTFRELQASEAAMWAGRHADRPFVLIAQQSIFDQTRTPDSGHTLWAYCHVPNGSTVDMTSRIEAQIERFAPGFKDTITGRHAAGSAWFERYNQNNVGGDITGGAHSGLQLAFRPTLGANPYRTPNPRLFICSASTPPGGGVHGMCGANAARDALNTTLA